MRNLSTMSAAAFLTVAVYSPVTGQVTLQRKHTEGRSVSYESTFLLNQVLTISGMEFKTMVDSGETHTLTTGKTNANGIVPITTKTDATRLSLTIPGGGQPEDRQPDENQKVIWPDRGRLPDPIELVSMVNEMEG